MSRHKEFNPDVAMQEALETFWERGYAATSVNDLLGEMGLNRGSLYGTFGDKKQLFLSVLDKYYEQSAGAIRELLERPGASAKKSLRTLVAHVATDSCGEKGRRGCLAAKAAMELAPHDKDVAAWVKRFHRRNVSLIARVIERGQRAGEISRRLHANDAARFILNSLAGMRVTGTIARAAEMDGVVELILKVLDE